MQASSGHRIGIETLFHSAATRNGSKVAKTQFFALRCASCTPALLVEGAATCKLTSDA